MESDEAKDILKELFRKSDDELLDKESIGGLMGGCRVCGKEELRGLQLNDLKLKIDTLLSWED